MFSFDDLCPVLLACAVASITTLGEGSHLATARVTSIRHIISQTKIPNRKGVAAPILEWKAFAIIQKTRVDTSSLRHKATLRCTT